MTLVCIRQPGYLPNIGFFKKIQSSDIFVYLDDVNYVGHGWDNRNQIRTDREFMKLTVPIVRKSTELLKDVLISNTENWSEKHCRGIELNYNKAPYFEKYWNNIEEILKGKWDRLIDLNLTLIEFFNKELEISTKTVLSSELGIKSKASKKLSEICKKLNADSYLSGVMGKEYLDEQIFEDNGIEVVFENFQHPVYRQFHGNFIPNMSIIDLLFNEGENSKKIIQNSINI